MEHRATALEGTEYKHNLTFYSIHFFTAQTLNRNYTIPKRKYEETEMECESYENTTLAPVPVLQDTYAGVVVAPSYPQVPVTPFERIHSAVWQFMEKPKTTPAGVTCKKAFI